MTSSWYDLESALLIRPYVAAATFEKHWDLEKMAANFLATLSNAFYWMTMYEFRLRFHWNLFLRFDLTLSQKWLNNNLATSHYLNQFWLVYCDGRFVSFVWNFIWKFWSVCHMNFEWNTYENHGHFDISHIITYEFHMKFTWTSLEIHM